MLAGWISHLGALARQPLKAERVEIEYPAPPWAERYEAFFGCPVEFGAPTNQLRLSQASLALANAEHCPSTWSQMLELCNRELEQLTRTRSWRERVSRLLGPMLNGREPDLEEVAARLKLPTWTLRRKLAEEGTQFRSILNDTRRDLAMVYIRETDLAFGEIATCSASPRRKPSSAPSSAGADRRPANSAAPSDRAPDHISVASSAGSGRSHSAACCSSSSSW